MRAMIQPPVLLRRGFSSILFRRPQRRWSSQANRSFLSVSEEVQEALHSKKPVVALESTIYTHGPF